MLSQTITYAQARDQQANLSQYPAGTGLPWPALTVPVLAAPPPSHYGNEIYLANQDTVFAHLPTSSAASEFDYMA
jgi:hypothetical protein